METIVRVRVTTRASREGISAARDGTFVISVHAAPYGGGANERVIALIADTFCVARSLVRIVSGARSRDKRVGVFLRVHAQRR